MIYSSLLSMPTAIFPKKVGNPWTRAYGRSCNSTRCRHARLRWASESGFCGHNFSSLLVAVKVFRVMSGSEIPDLHPYRSYTASRDISWHQLRDVTAALRRVCCEELRSHQLARWPERAACLGSLKSGNGTFVKQGDIEELKWCFNKENDNAQ